MMPSESLAVAVTSGFGVGIIAGIVSGVCYVIVHGFVRKRPRILGSQWNCSVCGVHFRSIEGVLDTAKVVSCIKCGGKVCKIRCSLQNVQNSWICQTCQYPESWFKGILKALQPNSIRVRASKIKMDSDMLDEIDEDVEFLKKKEKEHVRGFIERLVEAMLGSNIDNASIARVYTDEKYDILMTRFHADLSRTLTDLGASLHTSIANLPIIGQSPCAAHASLKLLIQKIIQEAIGLPTLEKAKEQPGAPADSTNRTYEDLLATAILNKVIQNYQDDLPSSSANSVSSRMSSLSRSKDKEYFFGEETLETKWKVSSVAGDVDTTSISSLEEWVRSDSSVGSTKFVDHTSLTIQHRIEEISSSDDDVDVADSTQEGWEDNWSMKKRKFGGTASPVPVPMLVPKPSTDAKVLIGDRDAEDTSDLSDVGSDFGDVDEVQGRESILVDSKTVIGGKNLLVNVNIENKDISEDESTDTADIVEEKKRVIEQFASIEQNEKGMEISETINAGIVLQQAEPDVSFESHIEQDSEYTERYATLPRTILKSPSPTLRRNIENIKTAFSKADNNNLNGESPLIIKKPILQNGIHQNGIHQNGIHQNGIYQNGIHQNGIYQNGIHQNGIYQNGNHENNVSTDEDDPHKLQFKGSYSEREKEKWNHGVLMKNNPYSSENLSRRLSQSSNSSVASMFGRDYYVREASKSSGARKQVANDDDDSGFHQLKMEIQSQEDSAIDSLNSLTYKATPTVIDTDNESSAKQTNSIMDISTDSDLSIERVYNLTSGTVYEKMGDTQRAIIEESRNPEGGFNKDSKVDENHNTTLNIRKRGFLRSLTQSSNEDYSPISSPTPTDPFNDNIPDVPITNPPTPVVNGAAVILNEEASLSSEKEFSLEYSTEEFESNTSSLEPLNTNSEPETIDLKDIHVVRNRLGGFSKSYSNLAAVPLKKLIIEEQRSNEIPPRVNEMMDNTTVGYLKKKFDKRGLRINKEEVHSLTARSLSREFRQELKRKENGVDSETAVKCEGNLEDISKSEDVKWFPNTKSRIKFFENLKHE